MHIALWIVQAVLAAAFLGAGSFKLFAYEKYIAMVVQHAADGKSGLSRGMVTFIGIAELAGAIGLIIPGVTNIAPDLTTWAAVGLSVIMVLAVGFHLRRGEPFTPALVLLLLSSFVAAGRMLS